MGLIGTATRASAADAKPTDDPSRKFFEQYCQTCHAGEKPKGDFRVDTLSQDFADKENREKWLNVVEQLKTGTMPPKGKPRPAANEAKALTDWIDGQVAAAETARNALQGRAVMRRLNQAEYQNTVRDLLGVELELKDLLPDDTAPGGFDTSAESLHISSYRWMATWQRQTGFWTRPSPVVRVPRTSNDASTSETSPPPGGRAFIATWTTAWRFSPPISRRISRSCCGSFSPATGASIVSASPRMRIKAKSRSSFT